MEDAVLDLLELALVARAAHDQLLALGLEVWALLLHDDSDQLVRQALHRDHEVEQHDLDGRLGEVVRVPQGRGHVEPEVLAVLDGCVPELDRLHAPRPEHLPQEHGLQAGVQLLLDVLQEDREPKLNGVLHRAHVIPVRELHNLGMPCAAVGMASGQNGRSSRRRSGPGPPAPLTWTLKLFSICFIHLLACPCAASHGSASDGRENYTRPWVLTG